MWGRCQTSVPKVSDCLHCIDHFSEKYPDPDGFLALLTGLEARVKELAPTWRPPLCSTEIPVPPADGEPDVEGWLHCTKFGYREAQGVRGKPKMVFILEVAWSILENTFKSQQSSVSPLFGPGHVPGNSILPFTVEHSVGFTRTLAVKVLLEALACMSLTDTEMQTLLPVLKSCFYIKFAYAPASSEEEQVRVSLRQKFQETEKQRPDVIQLHYAFRRHCTKTGAEISVQNLGLFVQDFNTSAIQGHNISALEHDALKMLLRQTPRFLDALEYH